MFDFSLLVYCRLLHNFELRWKNIAQILNLCSDIEEVFYVSSFCTIIIMFCSFFQRITFSCNFLTTFLQQLVSVINHICATLIAKSCSELFFIMFSAVTYITEILGASKILNFSTLYLHEKRRQQCSVFHIKTCVKNAKHCVTNFNCLAHKM